MEEKVYRMCLVCYQENICTAYDFSDYSSLPHIFHYIYETE